jgi:hypothetical protein
LFYRIPQVVSLAKTIEGYRNNRQLLRQYGPSQMGRWRTAACISESYAKTLLWRLAARTPAAGWLSSARSMTIDEDERQRAQQIVEQILAQDVPRRPGFAGTTGDRLDGRKPCPADDARAA